MIIYCVKDLTNNKIYIGQTIRSLHNRRLGHIQSALGCRDNLKFHNALRVHGIDNFVWEVLCECNSIAELDEKEIFYINQYDSFNSGYNLTEGGKSTRGYIFTDADKEKMRKKLIGNQNAKGNIMSELARHTISEKNKISMKGKVFSDLHRENLSKAKLGTKLSDATKKKLSKIHKGKKFTEEHKRKISEANKKYKGKLHSMFGKKRSESSKQKLRDWWKLHRKEMIAKRKTVKNKHLEDL